jgi:8-oxo-dGTP pyrophosphatase MutT (NUDIX family)
MSITAKAILTKQLIATSGANALNHSATMGNLTPQQRDHPRRQSVAALAVIRRSTASGIHWLAQWNAKWQALALVGGHKRPNESFRECAIREVTEELGIAAGVDFSVQESPLAQLQYVALSRSANEDTTYLVELFDTTLLTEAAQRKVNSNPLNAWLTTREIAGLKTDHGRPISETIQLLLTKAKLWPDPHISQTNSAQANSSLKGLP